MRWYCAKCRLFHEDDEMCPKLKTQLKNNPQLLIEAANFTVVAGQYHLVTSQTLDKVAQGINKLAGTNLSYEGTHQFARDIEVFKRLNEEAFSRSGHFSSAEAAKAYYEQVKNTPGFSSFESKLTGYSQEVDWLRMKQGEISSLWEKSSLLNNNAAGVDGITVNRFTGETISRTTIKASKNPMTANSTGINDVKEAIEKGTATEKDIIFGPEGTAKAAKDAGLSNPVVEKNSAADIQASNKRLEQKIADGKANPYVTGTDVAAKAAQGAIVGAAISLTVSSITNYLRYKNGEIDKGEAFKAVAKDTSKGALVGGAMGAITIYLPAGALGFIAGVAIGIYIGKVCSNALDEIYGDGAYGAILDSSGYVCGMTFNLEAYYKKIAKNNKQTKINIRKSKQLQKEINDGFAVFDRLKEE